MNADLRQALNDRIDAATPEELPVEMNGGSGGGSPSTESDDGDSFMGVVRDIVHGDTTPEDVEQRLVGIANDAIDLPWLTEGMEERLLSLVSDALVWAAKEAADSYL